MSLKPYLVVHRDPNFWDHSANHESFLCEAETAEHAAEQWLNAEPDAYMVTIVDLAAIPATYLRQAMWHGGHTRLTTRRKTP